MIIALFLMLILARFTWLLLQHLKALRHQIIDEQSLESKIALLERCLYRTEMIELYGDD